jgi:hypothetical protein
MGNQIHHHGPVRPKNKPHLIVKNFETAAGRDLADGGGMEAVVVVAVAGLHKDGRVGEALRIHLTTNIVQVHPLT